MNFLEKSILKTIIFFDVLDLALTLVEIHQNLIHSDAGNTAKYSLYDVIKILDESAALKEKTLFKNGFYFLKGREDLLLLRVKRSKWQIAKYRAVKKARKFFAILPFIDLVLTSGSLALGNIKEDSDVDVLVIARAGRIWTSRFFTIILFDLLRFRRVASSRNKICFYGFQTKNQLTLPCNLYHAILFNSMRPVYLNGAKGKTLLQEFQNANGWVDKFINYSKENVDNVFLYQGGKFSHNIKSFFEFLLGGVFGCWTEKILEKIQRFKISKNPKKNQQGSIIMENDKIEFHRIPPVEYARNIQERYEQNKSIV